MGDFAIRLAEVSKTFPGHSRPLGAKEMILQAPFRWRQRTAPRHVALQDITLDVPAGQFLGIFGHNGAGKSTLLSLIAGITPPDSGTIAVKGRLVPLLQLGAGFHPDLSGRENVILNGLLLGMRRAEILARMPEIIEFAGLGEFIDEAIYTYSTGMVARLGFAVAVHAEPDILLLDEVLAVGDVEFRDKCERTLGDLRSKGLTVLLVSHSPASIVISCDRLVVIRDHKVLADGDPAAVFQSLGIKPSGKSARRE